jgi:hypothetical protein
MNNSCVAVPYIADEIYECGTVVVFGGPKEITQSKTSHDTSVAGIVVEYSVEKDSTMSAYLAVIGRAPCKVLGPIKKGDLLTTSEIPGYAKKIISGVMGSIIGKAIEDFNDKRGIIEISVQRS